MKVTIKIHVFAITLRHARIKKVHEVHILLFVSSVIKICPIGEMLAPMKCPDDGSATCEYNGTTVHFFSFFFHRTQRRIIDAIFDKD